ncbi:hypothetical protein [Haloferula sp.]|uniref:hypothetical protein n=1 Tax=Haloferula sp. TaxID=2497595 RepID=UPI003C71D08F
MEKSDFEKWANSTQIKSVAGRTIEVPGAEFLAYFLIHKKERSPSRYPDIQAIKQDIKMGSETLEEWVDYDGKTLHVCDDCDSLGNTFTEHLGEAAGLAVVNRIHGLNEADWMKIPEIPGRNGRKTLDWNYASDGKDFIEMEAKGAFTEKVDRLAEISGHKASIKTKKKDSSKTCHPRYNQRALRYGTITSISKNPNSLLTVRLVDPEGEDYDRNPHDARILKRLSWASWLICQIAGRTQFSVALQNRLAALLRTNDLVSFNKLSLLGGTGKPMEGSQFIDRFFANRTSSKELQSAGVLTQFDKEHLLFIGLSRRWMLPIIRQRFDEISKLNFEPRSKATQLDCVLSPHQMDTKFPDVPVEDLTEDGNLLRFRRKAVLHQSAGGMVFGLVSKFG